MVPASALLVSRRRSFMTSCQPSVQRTDGFSEPLLSGFQWSCGYGRFLHRGDKESRCHHEEHALGIFVSGILEQLVDIGNLAQDRRPELVGSLALPLAAVEQGGAAIRQG